MPAPTLDRIQPLTTRQQRVYDFIRDHWFAHGYPPTLRDACEHLGIVSPNGVVAHLSALIRKGKVRRVTTQRHGETKTVYAPVLPELRVAPSGRGGYLVGSLGGPVPMTRAQLAAWLRARLAELET